MQIQTAPHDDCQGTGELPHPQAHQAHPCFSCAGHGLRSRTGNSYQSRAAAIRNGVPCPFCEGTGRQTYPATTRCFGCTEGAQITAALPGFSATDLPRALRFSRAKGELAEAYALSVKIQVVRQDRRGTFNEAYLGLGSLYSVTDYGTAFEADDPQALAAKVRTELATEGTQWCNLIRPDDTLTDTLLVLVHRNGYTVQAAAPAAPTHLPPTYTPELLNAPI